jgi:hypothetical protein
MSRERPSHECFVVEEREEGRKAYWMRVGSAWPHKDGKGFNVQLSALPANGGRIVLREVMDPHAEAAEQHSGQTAEDKRISELTRVASAGPGEPLLQLAEQVLCTGVGDALSAARRSRRKGSGTV